MGLGSVPGPGSYGVAGWFGFVGVSKNNGICEVAFLNDKDESGVVWVPFDEVNNQTYKQYK